MKKLFIDVFPLVWDGNGNIPKQDKKFMREVITKFPNAKIQIVFDKLSGWTYEVHLPKTQKDNYYTWLIAFDWCMYSLTYLLLNNESADFYYFQATQKYPERFK